MVGGGKMKVMRRRLLLPTLLLAAAAWFAAGPGGVTLQAIAACRHHARVGFTHHGHDGKPPPGTPCFCDEMTGGSDLALSPAVPAPAAVSAVMVALHRAVPFPLPPSPFRSVSEAPIPRPPNAGA
jgi:hypothetical protein